MYVSSKVGSIHPIVERYIYFALTRIDSKFRFFCCMTPNRFQKVFSKENTAASDSIRGGVTLDAYFKDGADGLGEISQYKGKTLRIPPNNALRYAFTLSQWQRLMFCTRMSHKVLSND